MIILCHKVKRKRNWWRSFKSVVGFVRENAEKEKKGLKEVPSNSISLHSLHYYTLHTTHYFLSLHFFRFSFSFSLLVRVVQPRTTPGRGVPQLSLKWGAGFGVTGAPPFRGGTWRSFCFSLFLHLWLCPWVLSLSLSWF